MRNFHWSPVADKLEEMLVVPSVTSSDFEGSSIVSDLVFALSTRSSLPKISWAFLMDGDDEDYYD